MAIVDTNELKSKEWFVSEAYHFCASKLKENSSVLQANPG